jgi:hypothetical protein
VKTQQMISVPAITLGISNLPNQLPADWESSSSGFYLRLPV